MRPLVGLAILASGGVGLVCLMVGLGDALVCSSRVAFGACMTGMGGSMRDVLGLVTTVGATVGGLFAGAILWQARRHRGLAEGLDQTARRERLAEHEAGLVIGLAAPSVAGLIRPQIYCPADLAELLDEDALRAVMLHERHHQLIHAPGRLVVLAAAASVLGRLEVGRRWIERRRAAIEIAADDHALKAGAHRSDLARALLLLGSADAPSLPSYTSASELRLRHLVGQPAPTRRGLASLAPVVLLAVAFVVCMSWGLVA